MHDRLVNEVAMVERHARFIGCALASADTFRRSLGRGFSFALHSRCGGTPQPLVVPAPHSRPFVSIRGFVSSSTITCSLNGSIKIQ